MCSSSVLLIKCHLCAYSVPFRHSLPKNELLNFLEEDPLGSLRSHPTVTSSVEEFRTSDHKTQGQIVDSIRQHQHSKKKLASRHHDGIPTDSELLGSMAARLALVERELLAAKKEVIEKDQHIQRLEERVLVLERSLQRQTSRGEQDQQTKVRQELELKCLALQKQVDDMEVHQFTAEPHDSYVQAHHVIILQEFLNDYGMVWVGESADGVHSKKPMPYQESAHDGVWVPVESMVGRGEFEVDFDAIVRNVEQLNALVGEGNSQVTTAAKCSKLKVHYMCVLFTSCSIVWIFYLTHIICSYLKLQFSLSLSLSLYLCTSPPLPPSNSP